MQKFYLFAKFIPTLGRGSGQSRRGRLHGGAVRVWRPLGHSSPTSPACPSDLLFHAVSPGNASSPYRERLGVLAELRRGVYGALPPVGRRRDPGRRIPVRTLFLWLI